MSALLLLHQAVNAPRFSIPQPTPTAPTSGLSTTMGTILAYLMWGALIVCGMAAIASGGYIAVGGMTGRPDHKSKGTSALIYALAGVVVVGAAIPIVNQFISIA